jgi:hypothetical protein
MSSSSLLRKSHVAYLRYPFVAGTLVNTDHTPHDWHDCNSRIILDDFFPPLFTLVVIELFKFYTPPLLIEVTRSLHHFLCFLVL